MFLLSDGRKQWERWKWKNQGEEMPGCLEQDVLQNRQLLGVYFSEIILYTPLNCSGELTQ